MKRTIIAAAALALLAAGCSSGEASEPDTFAFTGTVAVPGGASQYGKDGEQCSMDGFPGLTDLRVGTAVTVTDADGTTVGVGELNSPRLDGEGPGRHCVFQFLVGGLPEGGDFYGIEVGSRGSVTKSRADLNQLVELQIG